MKRPFGFMSGTGAVVAGIVVVGLFATTFVMGPVAFSPGSLNAASNGPALGGAASHAELHGRCGACHAAPWSSETMADRCMACHVDVATQFKTGQGLHGKLVGKLSTPTCRGCHTDHGGRSAPLTTANPKGFPHELTGYSLRSHKRTARGARVTCRDCHPKDFTTFDQRSCAQCHARLDRAFMSQHEASYGADCLACHHGLDLSGSDFDHNTLSFKLTGRHASVPCKKCHPDAATLQALRDTPKDCYSCHAKDDRHRGRFGRQCEQCHSAADWGDVTFDHNVFPIDHGKREQRATCETCHPNGLRSYTCFGCHAHTPANVVGEHEGRNLAQLRDCIRCHEGGRSEGD